MDLYDIDSPWALCEWWRLAAVNALDAAGCAPITTTYTGLGVVAWDDACGQLTVTPERVFRYDTFPVEKVDADVCGGDSIAVAVLITLVRCVPTLSDTGKAPHPQVLADAHKAALDDAAVVWNVATGTLPSEEWERGVVNQAWIGSEGGAVASETRFTIGLPEVEWCV